MRGGGKNRKKEGRKILVISKRNLASSEWPSVTKAYRKGKGRDFPPSTQKMVALLRK